ncbi:MAG: urea carboxylase-associated family protein [Proteobacteria bacterium]|nr:urea carboxylase-associated family protein [Pseudomonadota bacterium]MDA1324820.1 urea carboxylase-associated family protein [Pseudomonadota bacterium]
MKIISDDFVPANTGWGRPINKGQILRMTAKSIIDFACINLHNTEERFDQARTKVYNMKLWITTGDVLYSKLNNPMMTIIEDQFAGIGYHDLQYGTCSGPRFARAKAEGRLNQYHHGDDIPIPDHGCWENLIHGFSAWNIPPEYIPSPLNVFQHVDIDTKSGQINHSPIRPKDPIHVDFRAEMDLAVAASACPDLAAPQFGQSIQCMIYEP